MNFKDYLLVKEAAAFLGVSEGTLRNWGQRGKIATHHHPINGYRLYKRADLAKLLITVHRSAAHPRVGRGAAAR
jgi:DNA-binding transcriptional MerR regulator